MLAPVVNEPFTAQEPTPFNVKYSTILSFIETSDCFSTDTMAHMSFVAYPKKILLRPEFPNFTEKKSCEKVQIEKDFMLEPLHIVKDATK